jgi:alpha-galactosidase
MLTGFVGVENVQVVREKMVNNRLLYGKFTPFMEVVAINPREKSEDIALKLQSVLFGNPYLSFFTTTLSEDSKKTIRFWLDYWKKNYNVIFEGTFEPLQVSRFYPVIKVEHDEKTIYMLSEEYSVNLPVTPNSTIDIINSKATETIQLFVGRPGLQYAYEIFNCKGVSTEKGMLKTKGRNIVDLLVPSAGFVRITSVKN